jgi:Flp pilus assembly pilin Flp
MLQIVVALQALALTASEAVTSRLRREDGAAVVEYGIVLAFVVLALGGILFALQEPIQTWFNDIITAIGELKPT